LPLDSDSGVQPEMICRIFPHREAWESDRIGRQDKNPQRKCNLKPILFICAFLFPCVSIFAFGIIVPLEGRIFFEVHN
jgi:hypothetical protein